MQTVVKCFSAAVARKVAVPFACAVFLAAAFSACGGSSGGSTSAGSGGDGEGPTVGFFTVLRNEVTEPEIEGVTEVVEKSGGSVESFDSNFELSKQLSQIEDAVTTGKFDAFIIEPVDPGGLSPAIEAAKEAGIPVTAIVGVIGPDLNDLAPQTEGVVSTVAVTPETIGEVMARGVKESCADIDPCEVAILAGSQAAADDKIRVTSTEEFLEEDPAIEIVATQDTDYDSGKALSVTQDILQSHPGLDAIAGLGGDQAMVGAEVAANKAGVEVQLMGAGGSREAVKKIRAGKWFGTIALLPRSAGEAAGKDALAAVAGEEFPPSTDMLALVEEPLITKSNAGSFEPQW